MNGATTLFQRLYQNNWVLSDPLAAENQDSLI